MKDKLNENVFQGFIEWFSGMWNDASQYSDAWGHDSGTKGEFFRLCVYSTLGIAGVIAGELLRDKIKNLFTSAPGKIKQIVSMGKVIKNSSSKEDAEKKLSSMGVKVPTSTPKEPAMTNEAKQIKNVLTLLEKQVDKETLKKK